MSARHVKFRLSQNFLLSLPERKNKCLIKTHNQTAHFNFSIHVKEERKMPGLVHFLVRPEVLT